MGYAESILPEFDQEMTITRRVPDRFPDDKCDWRAHSKSQTIGWNANHLADLPGWVERILLTPGLDYDPPGGERYQMPSLRTRCEILELYDRNVASARRAITTVRDEEMDQTWTLLEGGKPDIVLPRRDVMRTWIINHMIHHRAILCVYYRLCDISVPGIYGPSADEPG